MSEHLQPSDYHFSKARRRLDIAVALTLMPIAFPAEKILSAYVRRVFNDDDVYFELEVESGNGLVSVKKIRTMYNDGPSDEEIGFNKDNPRIPNRTIKLIRDLRADELPQILQVLTGELSMVGPRKLPGQMLKYVEKTTDQDLYDEWRELTDQLPPGLTGPAQLSWLETDIRDKAVLERAMRLDNNYAVNGSLKEDLLILGKTAFNLGRIGLRLSHT